MVPVQATITCGSAMPAGGNTPTPNTDDWQDARTLLYDLLWTFDFKKGGGLLAPQIHTTPTPQLEQQYERAKQQPALRWLLRQPEVAACLQAFRKRVSNSWHDELVLLSGFVTRY